MLFQFSYIFDHISVFIFLHSVVCLKMFLSYFCLWLYTFSFLLHGETGCAQQRGMMLDFDQVNTKVGMVAVELFLLLMTNIT